MFVGVPQLMDQPANLARDGTAPIRTTWPAQPYVLPLARAHVRSWLSEVGFPTATSDDVVLAANEAVTNAIVHAYLPEQSAATFDLATWCEQGLACVAVQDRGLWRLAAGSEFGGHGLTLMHALVHSVDIAIDDSGTRVTLCEPIPGALR